MSTEVRQEIPTEVMRAITAGRKIEAIKLLREQTGMGLLEAKELVDSISDSGTGFSAHHPAAPRNDTGVGRLVMVLLALGVAVAAMLWLQG